MFNFLTKLKRTNKPSGTQNGYDLQAYVDKTLPNVSAVKSKIQQLNAQWNYHFRKVNNSGCLFSMFNFHGRLTKPHASACNSICEYAISLAHYFSLLNLYLRQGYVSKQQYDVVVGFYPKLLQNPVNKNGTDRYVHEKLNIDNVISVVDSFYYLAKNPNARTTPHYCRICGTIIPSGLSFCPKCGPRFF